jgi:pimeloyl-ACP methyl ester carboxylesterase
MSLTGPIFLDGIIVLTIAAFVAVIVTWPRLTGGTPWHLAGRVGALLLLNALVLLTAATQLNATYLFFASWGDLQGSLTGHLAQTSLHRGGGEGQAANLAVAGSTASVAAHPVPLPQGVGSSGLTKYVVHGPLSGLTGTVLVQLPPGYTSSAAAHARYPVLEAFHGYPSEPLNWIKVFHFPQIVDARVRAHQLRAPLVVMPSIEFPRGNDTEGVNGQRGQPQVETWLTVDVPNWVGQHFRVLAKRNAWATIGYSAGGFDAAMAATLHPAQYGAAIVLGGYSAGGFDAAMAATLHPAQYGAAIVLGGYFRPQFGPFYVPFTPSSRQGQRYDLPRTAAHRPPPVSMWVETSHADPYSYSSSAAFLHATRAPTAVHAVVLQNAGHRDSLWIGLMPEALRWLGSNVAGFRP